MSIGHLSTPASLCLALALVFFILAGFRVFKDRVDMGWWAFAFLALALVI
jgi:hypothetical protein